ncbi:leucine-rich repeat domain-containing protein [Flavobacterium sp. DGU11]|uniref:Leucine-rich repeat domain-containing protein n=1 Tax=Flavobacterium arundinis TaxID=3139143 RepID=A0ABU9HZW8_9FLAO
MHPLSTAHLPFLNLFFENSKTRIPEYLTPLGYIIYSELNPILERVYLIIDIGTFIYGKDFRAEVTVLAANEEKFRKYRDDKKAIYQYHHNHFGGDTVQMLQSKLGSLEEGETYFVESNYHSHDNPMDHVYKLKAEEYIATLTEWFTAHPVNRSRIYDLGNHEEVDKHVLGLYNSGSQRVLNCINLRDLARYGYGPRKSWENNQWFNKYYASLKDLVILSIRNNKSLLPEALDMIKGYKYLVELDLSDNNLDTVPPGLDTLADLKRVIFRHNNFTGMEGFTNLAQIQQLDLTDNFITAIPTEIAKMESLEVLDLTSNKITELPIELLQLKNLRVLNLSNNPLKKLPEWIGQLTGLEELHLVQTQLEGLPESFVNLKVSGKIYLKKNPFKELPAGMLGMGKVIDLEERNIALYNPKIKKKLEGLPRGNVKMSADLNFKLMVVQRLMYEDELLLPKFDVYEFVKNHKGRAIDLEEISYEMIPEVKAWFEDLDIPLELLWDIKELRADGGDEIYHELIPHWDGEDDAFDVVSAEDVKYFPNLKKITLMGNNKEVVKFLRGQKIKVSFL